MIKAEDEQRTYSQGKIITVPTILEQHSKWRCIVSDILTGVPGVICKMAYNAFLGTWTSYQRLRFLKHLDFWCHTCGFTQPQP